MYSYWRSFTLEQTSTSLIRDKLPDYLLKEPSLVIFLHHSKDYFRDCIGLTRLQLVLQSEGSLRLPFEGKANQEPGSDYFSPPRFGCWTHTVFNPNPREGGLGFSDLKRAGAFWPSFWGGPETWAKMFQNHFCKPKVYHGSHSSTCLPKLPSNKRLGLNIFCMWYTNE